MSKHTETPWKYQNISGRDRFGNAFHLHRIAQATSNVMVVHMEQTGAADVPDAAFIVRACNAHEGLVAALEETLIYWETCKVSVPQGLVNQASAALKLAGETERK